MDYDYDREGHIRAAIVSTTTKAGAPGASDALTNPPLGTVESARDIVQTIALALKRGYTPNEILANDSPIVERIRAEAAALRVPDAAPLPRREPTHCGYCDYEEADGELIEQCGKCKAADAAIAAAQEQS